MLFEVITPAEEICLLSEDELRAAAGITDTDSDADLLEVGRAASTSISRLCAIATDDVSEPTLLSETCQETFRWCGGGPIRLARRRVTEIFTVSIDGTTVDETGYEVQRGRNLIRLSNDEPMNWEVGKIIVIYQAGFSIAPSDLKLAAKKMVTSLWSERIRDPSLRKVTVDGIGSREYWVSAASDPLASREVSDLIAPYRELHV